MTPHVEKTVTRQNGEVITVGDLRELVAALGTVPDHYTVSVNTYEQNVFGVREMGVQVMEGDSADRPGWILLDIVAIYA